MFVEVLSSAAITLWLLFAGGLYLYHYIIEVVLDLPLTGQQSPCTAHAALKQLIEKLILEVLNMPALQKPQNQAAIPPDLNNKTYEDLLATAILNKVISNSQPARPSSSAASISSRFSTASNIKEEKEYFFGEETLENKWKNQDFDNTSTSSLEDWLQTDSSFGSRKYVDKLTLTIKQDIEEVSQISDSDEDNEEDNDSEYFKTRSSIWSDDEPNWFLQKRQFQTGTHSPVPVPMLVPNPTTEAKVLIGDKEVDETSDLSDVESEFGEAEIVPTRHSLLLNSKTVIGGKNFLQNGVTGGESGSESSADSGVKEVDRDQSTYDESEFMENLDNSIINKSEDDLDGGLFVSKADIHIDDDNVEDASLLSVYSNTEQEAEYTEQYASLPRKIEKRPQPPARPSLQKIKAETSKSDTKNEETEKQIDKDSDDEVRMVQMHFSGIYSRREKEKWKNAIEMKNNPYTKENIEKRIKRSNSGAGSLFGPDYYAKLASSPSGTKAKSPKSPEAKNLPWPRQQPEWPPQEPENNEQFDTKTLSQEKEQDKNVSKTYIASEEERDIYRAKPIVIERTDDLITIETPEEFPKYSSDTHPTIPKTEDSHQKMPEPERESSPEYVAEITSDSDLSYINCYDVGNSQVYKKSTEKEPQLAKTGFTKNTKSPNYQRTIVKKSEPPTTLKRYKSESDLYNDFDAPPKVLPQKRDNTLISKIYKVLSKSDLLSEYPTFRTQMSSPDGAGYNHNDELIRNKTDYSSHEIPLSSIEISNNRMTITKNLSLSSEDDNSDLCSFYSEYRPIKNVFHSNEDLLSMDESDRSMKKDNTLISKIYKQQNVKNYALAKRQQIPEIETNTRSIKEVTRSDGEYEDPLKQNKVPISLEENGNAINNKVSVEKNENVLEVNELAKKRIVHNILDQISHSTTQKEKSQLSKHYTNGKSKEDINEESKESDDDEITTSVKDLMKKFENNVGKNQVVSSLTARSLSRHTRKPLKD
ncbi:unnamed protein product [Psylliodes chrysocephalus]|uniref:Uncharacterized protein n=1 Tax=Psylliodes chrysocephalus TaxID=3402493 RepID=A0A9P0CT00_9CUCU|nr:unnamed protein product [Psylliodes chrysocephala]